MAFGSTDPVDHEAEAAQQAEIAEQVVEDKPVEPAPKPAPAVAEAETPAAEEESVSHSAPVAPSVEDEDGHPAPVSGALIEGEGVAVNEPSSPLAPQAPEPRVTVQRAGAEPVNIAIGGFQIDLTDADSQPEVPKSIADLLSDSDYVEVAA